MSERKSWDIQPKRKEVQAPPAPAPIQPSARARTARRPAPPAAGRRSGLGSIQEYAVVRPAKPTQTIRREKVPQGKEREPLKARRRRARKRLYVILSILFVLAIAAVFFVLWLPAFRIQNVNAAGLDTDGMQSVARSSITGSIDYVLPKDSIFFYPESAIRSAILGKYPDIAAVSISRTSFSSIAIDSVPRESAFLWCGTTYGAMPTSAPIIVSSTTEPASTENNTTVANASSTVHTDTADNSNSSALTNIPTCYNADSQGFIYAVVPPDQLSSQGDTIHVYSAITGSASSPLGSQISNAAALPGALQFVKAIKSLNVPIVSLVLRDDEADLYAQSGTRITYVLGKEQAAAQLAASAFPQLNLNDGSLEYVDLRFDGKIYFKNVGSAAATSASTNPTTAQ